MPNSMSHIAPAHFNLNTCLRDRKLSSKCFHQHRCSFSGIRYFFSPRRILWSRVVVQPDLDCVAVVLFIYRGEQVRVVHLTQVRFVSETSS
jgi:hypothetical protein